MRNNYLADTNPLSNVARNSNDRIEDVDEDDDDWKIVQDDSEDMPKQGATSSTAIAAATADVKDTPSYIGGGGVLIVPEGESYKEYGHHHIVNDATDAEETETIPSVIRNLVVDGSNFHTDNDRLHAYDDDTLTVPDTDSLPTNLESILKRAAPSDRSYTGSEDSGEIVFHVDRDDNYDISQLSNTAGGGTKSASMLNQSIDVSAVSSSLESAVISPIKTWGLGAALMIALGYIGYLHSSMTPVGVVQTVVPHQSALLLKSHLQAELKQWQDEMAQALQSSQQQSPLSVQEIQDYIEQAVKQAQQKQNSSTDASWSERSRIMDQVVQEYKIDIAQQLEDQQEQERTARIYERSTRSRAGRSATKRSSAPQDMHIPTVVEQVPVVVERETLQEGYDVYEDDNDDNNNNNNKETYSVDSDVQDFSEGDNVVEEDDDEHDEHEHDEHGQCSGRRSRTAAESKARKLAQNLGQRLFTAQESFWSAVEWNAEHVFDEAGDYAGESWAHTNTKIRQTATEAQKWTKHSLQLAKKGIAKAHEKIMEVDKSVTRLEKQASTTRKPVDLKGVATVAGSVIFVSLATIASNWLTASDDDSN